MWGIFRGFNIKIISFGWWFGILFVGKLIFFRNLDLVFLDFILRFVLVKL